MVTAGECLHCGQMCEWDGDCWIDIASGRTGCVEAFEAGVSSAEHEVDDEPVEDADYEGMIDAEEERYWSARTTDEGYEERILDAEMAAAELAEEV